MRITLKGTNIELTDELRDYMIEKFGSLERFFPEADPDTIVVDVEIGKPSRHHRKGDVYLCEINLVVAGTLLRSEETRSTLEEAVDVVRDEIERQARKMVSRRRALFLRRARDLSRRFRFFRFRRDKT